MEDNKQVRLQDIADSLKVTKVTVSKALRDHFDISDAMRKKVKEKAKEMGYTPNQIARSLSSKRSHTIGVIVPKIAHTFFSRVIDGMYEIALKHDYNIILCVSREDETLEHKHIESLLGLRVDGLLISLAENITDTTIFSRIQKMDVPVVMFDRVIKGLGISTVTVDDREASCLGVEELINQGFKKIAHIAGYDSVSIGRDRRQGYEDALTKHGHKVDADLIIEGGFNEKDGYEGFKKLVQKAGIPEAVFVTSFPVGVGVYDAMRELKISHDKVKVLSFGEGRENRFLPQPMLCIDQPTRDLGIKAFMVLLEQIQNPGKAEATDIVLQGNIKPVKERFRLAYM